MALYEYECDDEHVTTLTQPMDAKRPTSLRCSHLHCGKKATRRFSTPAINGLNRLRVKIIPPADIPMREHLESEGL